MNTVITKIKETGPWYKNMKYILQKKNINLSYHSNIYISIYYTIDSVAFISRHLFSISHNDAEHLALYLSIH